MEPSHVSNSATESVKMLVDADLCIGAGQCEMVEAEVFRVNDETVVADVLGDGLLPVDRALIVIDACPVQAISSPTL